MPPPPPPRQQPGGPVSEAHRLALIPSSRMEFPTQRRWAVSIFVLLQSWKITDLWLAYTAAYPEQYSGILMKWWLIDTIYLLCLHVAKIPWLQFSVIKTLLLTLFMLWLNFVLFVAPTAGLGGIFFKNLFGDSFGKQTSISQGRLVNVKDIVQNSSHILGRHTVHILPYGTAKLNPNNEVYCLTTTEIGKKDIFIPIILNNTAPRTVSISRYDFDTNQKTIKDYSGRDIQRATEIGHTKEGVEYYYVRVRNPGAYKLEKIVSKDGVDVRLYNRHAFVFTCPYAQFKPIVNKDYCTGDKETLQLEVIGVPPLNIEYIKKSAGHREAQLKLDRIQPEGFESPLLLKPRSDNRLDSSLFDTKLDDNYNWASVQQVNVPLNLTFNSASKQEYTLLRVVDGVGNELDLSGLSASQTFEVHQRPSVQFKCSETDPIHLLIGSKSTQIPLALEGSSPFQLEYTFSGDEVQHKAKLTSASSISVSSPGEYNLVSVSDRYCQGQVMFPSSCHVVQPQLPSVKIQATPIASECAGDNEVGMKFVAEFVGAPPYVLEYEITKQSGRSKKLIERKRETIDRSRHIFSYLPSSSGEYTYRFISLDDRHYKKRPTDMAPIQQTVHPQPDARFKTKHAVRTCLGEDLTAEVELRGTGPFVLTWMVGDQLYSDRVEGDRYTIQLPPFDRPGRHLISLIKIQDDNHCVKDLEARDFTIDVRRDRPNAFFFGDRMNVTEGAEANLPVRLTGEGPWTVSYRHVESNQKATRRFHDPNASVTVHKPGHYELLTVEDAICKGDVVPSHYAVQWIDKPTISVPKDQGAVEISHHHFERRAVCQGTNDAIDIEFDGQGPFYCSYTEYRGAGRSFYAVKQEEIATGNRRYRFPLKTSDPGKYRYVFDRLADQRYTEPFKLSERLQIEQVVHAKPTVKFSSRSTRKERTVCVGDTWQTEMDPIYIEFTGVAPFSVEFGLRLESEMGGRVIQVDNIMTNKYKLDLPDEVVHVAGTYDIKLLSVNDANGCGAAVVDDTTVKVKALDIATITAMEVYDDVCVGDTVDFSLSGVGPFTVHYMFNGKSETAKTATSKLSMIADKPGNLTILSVGDQRNQCRSFPKNMMKRIHEVPSSYISGGKEIIESIHEGDMVQATVDLVGTPPFNFEWRRSRLVWDHVNKRHYKGEVLESHIVTGILEHQYLINTSVEGIIEIVSIKDQYCQYPI
ncbi:uncharacterized protein BX663DRAFT_483356 [Cokeromyces recurvatus]|uniref:uncharacterized protein n=1 Tax=Cokeromyces recurvatus TaxID=90255 RepID=UPI00221F3E76|nr:uncharacterized protein BX663DRAFT_483356 [Cokeromyces recurvatus]KAI7906649.1 hypothetical protein BX663DRAFT_483356 [Cokeromyces recurvatus]